MTLVKIADTLNLPIIERTIYVEMAKFFETDIVCLLYTSPSPRDVEESRMPSSA